MAYNIKLEQFEGPLDLLLEIVETRKLNILDISLASATQQFLAYIRTLKERSMEEITQFLVVASRLALLKSRELVPTLNDNLDDDGDIETLKRQLARYYPYRRAAKLLQRADKMRQVFQARPAFSGHPPVFSFPKNVSAPTLHRHMTDLLHTATLARSIPQAHVRPTISLETCITHLTEVALGKKKLNFSLYLAQKKSDEKVVHFVGMLELVRMGKIQASQAKNFGTIMLTSTKPR